MAKKTVKKAVKKSKKSKAKVKTVKSPKRAKKATQKTKSGISLGRSVPKFSAQATGGKTVSSDELKNKKVVLYFYPKDMTPGCTIEGHEFSKLKSEFESINTVVFGISRDTVKSHEKFIEKECYSIDLLSDENEKLCKIFGVIKMKNMYGKKVRGIERSTFVINEEGKLIQEWRGVKAEGHAQAVLDQLRSLS